MSDLFFKELNDKFKINHINILCKMELSHSSYPFLQQKLLYKKIMFLKGHK